MAWRDRYLPASFRGHPFVVEAHEADVAGRRVQTHEYPGRDRPWSEDLGRKAKEFEVKGYIVGADYMERRDRLIEACDKAGPGLLVHPYLGHRQVACTDCKVSERTAEGGMCRLTLRFSEAGRNQYPTDRADSAAVVSDAAEAARSAVIGQFTETFTL